MSEIEIPFTWTCPKCGHRQTDTVNPDFGPFCTVVCEPCGPRDGTFEAQELSPNDADAWDRACVEAERQAEEA